MVAERNLPSMIVINKMDRERADFSRTLGEIRGALPVKPVVVQIPIGAEEHFRGIVDVVSGKAYQFEDGGKGTLKETAVPDDLADELALYRENLMESVAETDDDLIEKFLEEGELTDDEILAGLRAGVAKALITPVCVCSALLNKGTAALLDSINLYLPSPADRPARIGIVPGSNEKAERKPAPDEPFSALVFKTMADPYAGRLTIFKVWSGVLKGDSFSTRRRIRRSASASCMCSREKSRSRSTVPARG